MDRHEDVKSPINDREIPNARLSTNPTVLEEEVISLACKLLILELSGETPSAPISGWILAYPVPDESKGLGELLDLLKELKKRTWVYADLRSWLENSAEIIPSPLREKLYLAIHRQFSLQTTEFSLDAIALWHWTMNQIPIGALPPSAFCRLLDECLLHGAFVWHAELVARFRESSSGDAGWLMLHDALSLIGQGAYSAAIRILVQISSPDKELKMRIWATKLLIWVRIGEWDQIAFGVAAFNAFLRRNPALVRGRAIWLNKYLKVLKKISKKNVGPKPAPALFRSHEWSVLESALSESFQTMGNFLIKAVLPSDQVAREPLPQNGS
ncbi:hypothetical protein [Pontibacter sp. G13]|uniref:hypothetical protein n=1 Tax=Pontibacter sp. G13 TaxID=3074898 RepID=UPI00288AB21A|nr:hypothetical protein [Pontibacter sp. G13]WNJ18857.1 hypothetical protein RJD25_00040 [Pontibacter sp. G13]